MHGPRNKHQALSSGHPFLFIPPSNQLNHCLRFRHQHPSPLLSRRSNLQPHLSPVIPVYGVASILLVSFFFFVRGSGLSLKMILLGCALPHHVSVDRLFKGNGIFELISMGYGYLYTEVQRLDSPFGISSFLDAMLSGLDAVCFPLARRTTTSALHRQWAFRVKGQTQAGQAGRQGIHHPAQRGTRAVTVLP